MVKLFVRSSVASYPAWRKYFDGCNDMREHCGCVAHGVYQSVEDKNDVTIWHDFTTRKRAETFAASKELKAAQKAAGVKRSKMWIVNETKAKKPAARRTARRG